jgi:hypothetical protein
MLVSSGSNRQSETLRREHSRVSHLDEGRAAARQGDMATDRDYPRRPYRQGSRCKRRCPIHTGVRTIARDALPPPAPDSGGNRYASRRIVLGLLSGCARRRHAGQPRSPGRRGGQLRGRGDDSEVAILRKARPARRLTHTFERSSRRARSISSSSTGTTRSRESGRTSKRMGLSSGPAA